jgi:hypothetical protein
VGAGARAGGADSGDDHEDDPAGRRRAGYLPEHEQASEQRDPSLALVTGQLQRV